MKQETLTLILVNLAGIMERADQSLLPGVYKEVGSALHTDPTGLGSLTLFRSVVQSSCYPLAAFLAVHHNRTHVIALGAFLWAAATFLVAVSSTFLQVAISRGLNGIGLAIVLPAIQSLVADSTDETNRGIAFGWLQLTGNIGSIIGGLFGVLIATTSFMGIAGWRIAFHLVGLISVLVGILILLFAQDPSFSKNKKNQQKTSFCSDLKHLLKEANSVIRIPTFQIIVAQGIAGSFPWTAFSFIPMWLELIGFSHTKTAFLWSLYIIGNSLGGLFGGRLGDILAKHFPNSGRIFLSQVSAGSAVPLGAILLRGLPEDPSFGVIYGFVFFVLGFFTSWNAPATNNPIFAEIVPEKSRTSIYALDQCFESIMSSFAPPLVGLLSQYVYGYRPESTGSSDSVKTETDNENAESLAKALYIAFGLSLSLCCLIYTFLYCTYPRDRERVRMQVLIESEILQLEGDDSPLQEKCSEGDVSGRNELGGKEGREWGTSIEMQDSDDRTLLSGEVRSDMEGSL